MPGCSAYNRRSASTAWALAHEDALDPIAGPLQNLANVLSAIAPHYDIVSSNDAGLRVIKDILVDMGISYLGSRIGTAPLNSPPDDPQ